MKLNTLLLLLIFVSVGCAEKSKPEVEAPLISNVATKATSDLSEALPSPDANESFSSLSKKDLIDGFYYHDTRFEESQVNNAALRIRLAVLGDKACYLATGLGGTDFEIESLVRESLGVWRGMHSNRYFTQPTFNSLVVYTNDKDKEASYENSLVRSDDLRLITAEFKRRNRLVDNITRLSLPNDVEAVYRNNCLDFQPIYFRGKLKSISSNKKNAMRKIENQLIDMSNKKADKSVKLDVK